MRQIGSDDMRLHTDILSARQVYAATAGIDGVDVELTSHGSRSRDHAFEVHLVAEQRKGRRRSNTGTYGAGYDWAATWDEWGLFFAALYDIDSQMTCWAYDGADDFSHSTGGRFDGEPFTPHDQHRWSYFDSYVSKCKCGAVRNQSALAARQLAS
jgi:hypothetical protein